MTATIKQRLDQGELVRVMGVGRVLHHNLVQIIGIHGGFHGLWFDIEHTGLSVQDVEVGSLAARAYGMDVFCRVAPTDYATVTRYLEAGASGIMAAQIFTPEQAEEFVTWAKFAPRGQRGLNVGGWDGKYGTIPAADFCRQANDTNFVAIQIETAESAERCEEVAAIDGVDMLFVGPADLSQSLGVTGDFMNDKCIAAIDRVAAACKKHGIHWGAVSAGPAHAKMMIEKGCGLISPTSDAKMINSGIEAVVKAHDGIF